MDKKQMKSGLDALFGAKVEQPTDEEKTQQGAAETQKTDIIDTIDDAELARLSHAKRMDGRGRPRKNTIKPDGSSKFTRACIVVDSEQWDLIREIAFRESLQLKEVVSAAFRKAIASYEATHGKIQSTYKQRHGDASQLFTH